MLFIIIYSLPNHTSGVIQEVLSTGIHVPVLLGVAGFMLSKYKPQLSNEIKRNTFLVVSIALNVDYIALNWKIALFILSIILGKFIWIDFVFDSQNIVKSLRAFQNSDTECNDYDVCTLKDFKEEYVWKEPVDNTIQLLYNPIMNCPNSSMDEPWEISAYINASIKEPEVAFRIIPTIEDVQYNGDYDYAVLAQSPNYTPANADFIMDIFRQYIMEI